MQKFFKIVILLFFVGVITFSSGFLIGKNISFKNYQTSLKNQLIAEFEQKLAFRMKKGLVFFGSSKTFLSGFEEDSAEKKYFFEGNIDNIEFENNTISIKVENKYETGGLLAYLNEPDFYIKTVRVDNLTKIIKREIKNNEELGLEKEQWKEVKIDGKNMLVPIPSSSFVETEISIKDLKSGSKAMIETESAFNLRSNGEIKAKRIVVDF